MVGLENEFHIPKQQPEQEVSIEVNDFQVGDNIIVTDSPDVSPGSLWKVVEVKDVSGFYIAHLVGGNPNDLHAFHKDQVQAGPESGEKRTKATFWPFGKNKQSEPLSAEQKSALLMDAQAKEIVGGSSTAVEVGSAGQETVIEEMGELATKLEQSPFGLGREYYAPKQDIKVTFMNERPATVEIAGAVEKKPSEVPEETPSATEELNELPEERTEVSNEFPEIDSLAGVAELLERNNTIDEVLKSNLENLMVNVDEMARLAECTNPYEFKEQAMNIREKLSKAGISFKLLSIESLAPLTDRAIEARVKFSEQSPLASLLSPISVADTMTLQVYRDLMRCDEDLMILAQLADEHPSIAMRVNDMVGDLRQKYGPNNQKNQDIIARIKLGMEHALAGISTFKTPAS